MVPTPDPDQDAACSAWRQIASDSIICSTTSSCTHLQCDFMETSTDITVLPCATPPSVSVVTTQGGSVLYRNTFSQSEIVPVSTPSGITLLKLNVSLAVSPNRDSMTLEVCTEAFVR